MSTDDIFREAVRITRVHAESTTEQLLKLRLAEADVGMARKQLADAEAQADVAQMRVSQWEQAVKEHEARLAQLHKEME